MTIQRAGVYLRGLPLIILLGISAPILAAASRPAIPLGNPGEWVTASDYPAVALRHSMQGIAGFRLTIDPSGRVEKCDIVRSSSWSELDTATCNLVAQRARFTPAIDRRGRPVPGTYTNIVRWVIPERLTPITALPGTAPLLTLDPDGNLIVVR